MQTILRDGIAIRIPPDVSSEGGAAVEAYVAAVPADCFPPIPTDLRGTDAVSARTLAPALDAYLEELRAAGVLAAFQVKADTHYDAAMQAHAARIAKAHAAVMAAAPAVSPELLDRARQAARQTIAELGAAPDATPSARTGRPARRHHAGEES